jgi:UDP-glucose:(heptosyl)LPS alpha-1,3-glucosyltransferase
MKIAIVIEHFNPRRGGAETYTAYLVERLAFEGHEVSLLSEDWAVEPAGVTMVRVPVKGITAAGRYLSFATEASELAMSGEFEVIHSMARIMGLSLFHPHGGVMRASLERSLASSHSAIEKGLRKAARWLNTKSDMLLELEAIIYEQDPPPRLVAVSNMVAADMKRYYDAPAARIDVVYNGVDLKRFRPANRAAYRSPVRAEINVAEDDLLLLLVAHNFRLKGVEILVKALAELEAAGHANVKGLVVGGQSPVAYEDLAQKLGVSERIIFHEAADDIERYYAAADIYLHPTFYDPMSLVVLEALASGLPVITTRYNGASEIMTEGLQGFTVPEPRDIGAIVSAVETLLDAGRRRDMSAAARSLAEEFPLERNYEGIMEVYRRAIADGLPARVQIKKGS